MVPGLWLLLPHQYQVLTGTPLGYPVVALCHGYPEALDLQDWPFLTLQEFIDEIDFGVSQLKTLDLGHLSCSYTLGASLPVPSPSDSLVSLCFSLSFFIYSLYILITILRY